MKEERVRLKRSKSAFARVFASLVLRVEIFAEAERDLEQIADFIARDDPVAIEAWVTKLIAVARAAGTNPRAGRVVPELKDPKLREVFLRTYRIIYRVEPTRIVVLTVLEGRRRLKR